MADIANCKAMLVVEPLIQCKNPAKHGGYCGVHAQSGRNEQLPVEQPKKGD
ncbi:hypothetical protein LCGC14_0587780 [marine sediment metagenome]|uniref:Uncharacterized protein n=1 Tax=marine sediment metagenome TaxID=412755 RepID=A0A0F9REH9_9ZZZZ